MQYSLSFPLITRTFSSGGINSPYTAVHPGSSALLPSSFILLCTCCSHVADSFAYSVFSIVYSSILQLNQLPLWVNLYLYLYLNNQAVSDHPLRSRVGALPSACLYYWLSSWPSPNNPSQLSSQLLCDAIGCITRLNRTPSGQSMHFYNDQAIVLSHLEH